MTKKKYATLLSNDSATATVRNDNQEDPQCCHGSGTWLKKYKLLAISLSLLFILLVALSIIFAVIFPPMGK